MRVWLVSFVFLFVLVQFYQWLQNFIPPLPVYVFAGAFLAIASNYDSFFRTKFFSTRQNAQPTNNIANPVSQVATLVNEPQPSLPENSEQNKANQDKIS